MKELQAKLNKEYEKIGTITIGVMHEEIMPLSGIIYVESIMEIAEPIKSDEPIVVAKSHYPEGYVVIDGYHRLKSKIQDGEKEIRVILLDDYKISRKADSLLDFISGLKGSTVRFASDEAILVDGELYEIKANEGCGGCGNGWSNLKVLEAFVNKDIDIKTVEAKNDNGDDYELHINGEMVAEVDTGYGNGYYGGDFKIFIRS